MGGRQHHVHGVHGDLPPGHLGGRRRVRGSAHPEQGEVDPPLGDLRGRLPLRPGRGGGDRHAGRRVGQTGQQTAQQRPVCAAQPETPQAGAGAGEERRLLLELGHRRQHHAGAGQHQLTQRRRPHPEPPALEERAAERPLDPLQLRAQCGLGQPQRLRRTGQTARVGHLPDHPQMTQLQLHGRSLVPGPDQRKGRRPGRRPGTAERPRRRVGGPRRERVHRRAARGEVCPPEPVTRAASAARGVRASAARGGTGRRPAQEGCGLSGPRRVGRGPRPAPDAPPSRTAWARRTRRRCWPSPPRRRPRAPTSTGRRSPRW